MLKIATSSQMHAIDRATIKNLGIPGKVLMERAGLVVAQEIMEAWPGQKTLVVCGTGNNGGDGLVIARELHNSAHSVKVIIAGQKQKLGRDCASQYETAVKLGLDISFTLKLTSRDLHGAVVVDALFGTGLNKSITGPRAALIRKINASGQPVVSVDIPSGISADTGEVLGEAVIADMTVTFGLPKRGHFLYPGAEHKGELVVENIGFPEELFDTVDCCLPSDDDIAWMLPHRPLNAHKNRFGHVLMVAGSRGKVGAAFLASEGCLRAGAGLVTVAGPDSLSDIYQTRTLEEMFLPLPDTGGGAIGRQALAPMLEFLENHATVLSMGPGMGTDPATASLVRKLVPGCPVPMVLDADALNALSGAPGVLKKCGHEVVLTPHPGEFERLSGISRRDMEADRIGSVSKLAQKTGAVVLLKGAPTIIATPEGDSFINPTGNSGLATAGSGDVLTGIITGLMAQGANALEAALSGAYLHGLCADMVETETSSRSLIASDLLDMLPEAMAEIEAEGP